MVVKNLTTGNFDEFISKGNIIVDFYADWCGPCKIISPLIEEVSNEIKTVKFGKINVDKENELAQKFHVMSIPTLIFFKDKKQVERITGALPKEELEDTINKLFS